MTTTIPKPLLPDSVLVFSGDSTLSVEPSANETVAVIAPHTWGPVGLAGMPDPVVGSVGAFEAAFGTDSSALRDGAVGAFVGMGLSGAMGAGGVIPYRIANAPVTASRVINNTAGAPAAALTLAARYPGTRGNGISYVIDDDPVDGTKDRLRILVDGRQRESYSYPATDITGLAASINARPSSWVTATMTATGTALAPTAGTSLTGGTDGTSALTSTDYDTATRALEFLGYRVVIAPGVTTAALKVQLATWVAAMRDQMRPVQLVIGGALGEDVGTASAELTSNPSLREEHVVRLSVGTWHDDYFNRDMGTASLVGRVAGAMCARGLSGSLTRARFAGLHAVGAAVPTLDDLVVGRDAGLTMFRRVSAPDAEIAISEGVSTYIDKTQVAKPYELFSEPRIVGVLDFCVRHMSEWGNQTVVGDLPVTDDTRNLVRKEARKLLDDLEGAGLAEPGSGFVTVEPPEDPALRDSVPYVIGFIPTRTAKYLIGQGRVS